MEISSGGLKGFVIGIVMIVAVIISWHVGFNNGVDTKRKPEIQVVRETCHHYQMRDGSVQNFGCY